MADGFNATDATGATVAILTDQVTDGVLGTGQKQIVGIMDATPDSTNKLIVNSSGQAKVDASGSTNLTVTTAPVAGRTTDSVNATLASDALMVATTAVAPQFAKIVASSSGATTIVAAVSSKVIRVVSLVLVANGAVNVKWQSHVTPTDLTGLSYLAANGGVVLPFNPVGWFQTVSGEALDINLSGAVAVGGCLTYIAL